jgi:hypothetical protein
VASFTHFVAKLFFAAPESFLSAALSDDAVASDAHLVMKLLGAAPASFYSSEIPKVLNSTEDAHTNNMNPFEADEHLRGRHALIYVGASYA